MSEVFFSAFWRIFVDFRYVNGRQIQTRGDKWVSWYQYRIRDAPDFWPAGLSENRLPNIRLAVYSLLISGSEPTSCSSCKMLIPIQEVKTPRDDWNGRTKLSFNFILTHRIAIFCHSRSHIIFFSFSVIYLNFFLAQFITLWPLDSDPDVNPNPHCSIMIANLEHCLYVYGVNKCTAWYRYCTGTLSRHMFLL